MQLDFYNIDRFCRDMPRSESVLSVDLSSTEFISQFALVYLGLFVRWKRSQDISFNVKLPQNLKTRQYLDRQGFLDRFNLVKPIVDQQPEYSVSMTDIENNPDLAEDYSNRLKRLLINLKINIDANEFCEISAEILDNFVIHSEDTHGVCAFQSYPNKHEIRIAFGDCGIGIRRSLSKNPLHEELISKPSPYAIGEAIKEGISRFTERRGSGLSMVLDYILKIKGELFITSEDGYFRLDRIGKPKLGFMEFNLPGVQIEIAVPVQL